MVDVLAFGAHPDDIELGAGGSLAQLTQRGRRVALVDLTRGELSTNGTVEERDKEASKAAQMLGAPRENLNLPDGGLEDTPSYRRRVIEALRKHRPSLVLYPAPLGIHPDHQGASKLIASSIYFSGVRRYAKGEPFRPQEALGYYLAQRGEPDIVVDVTDVYEEKLRLILCYSSQFTRKKEGAFPTTINSPAFLQRIQSRDQYFGSLVGALFGEGFVRHGPLLVHDVVDFFVKEERE